MLHSSKSQNSWNHYEQFQRENIVDKLNPEHRVSQAQKTSLRPWNPSTYVALLYDPLTHVSGTHCISYPLTEVQQPMSTDILYLKSQQKKTD